MKEIKNRLVKAIIRGVPINVQCSKLGVFTVSVRAEDLLSFTFIIIMIFPPQLDCKWQITTYMLLQQTLYPRQTNTRHSKP